MQPPTPARLCTLLASKCCSSTARAQCDTCMCFRYRDGAIRREMFLNDNCLTELRRIIESRCVCVLRKHFARSRSFVYLFFALSCFLMALQCVFMSFCLSDIFCISDIMREDDRVKLLAFPPALLYMRRKIAARLRVLVLLQHSPHHHFPSVVARSR